MRRQIAILGIIATLVVAIAILRSDRHRHGGKDPITASTIGKSEAKNPDPTSEVAGSPPSEPFQPPPEIPEPKAAEDASRTAKERDGRHLFYGSPQRKEVTFLNPAGQPVEGAVVIVFRSTGAWKTHETSEARTDREGKIEITTRLGIEKVHLFSYKEGEGWQSGSGGVTSVESKHSMTYLPPNPMKIWCRGPNGDLRGHAAIVVTGELNMSNRFPDPIWIRFPPRCVNTDELGKCSIEGLPALGPSSDGRVRMPGCRFTITATWEGRTAELKFDDFPLKEVLVVIE